LAAFRLLLDNRLLLTVMLGNWHLLIWQCHLAAFAGASRCQPGFYSLKGSRKPCQQCPYGRTTADDTSQQRLPTDCYVRPGFGLVSSTGNTTDGTGYITDPSALADDAAVVIPVLDCPVGYWSAGLSIKAVCTKCSTGSTTKESAQTAAAQCSGACGRVPAWLVDTVCGGVFTHASLYTVPGSFMWPSPYEYCTASGVQMLMAR
jgi:hypothetical protein